LEFPFPRSTNKSQRELQRFLRWGQIANSLTEQCGHETFQISGFWADYGLSAPYCLLAPTGVAMPPRTAEFGNRDRFELKGKIGLHRPQDHSASGMLPVAA